MQLYASRLHFVLNTASHHHGGCRGRVRVPKQTGVVNLNLALAFMFGHNTLGKTFTHTHTHTQISIRITLSPIAIVEIIAVFAVSHTRVCVVWCVCVQIIKLVTRGRECWVMRSEQTQH